MMRNAFDGKDTLMAGKYVIICIPLIIPHTCAKHPYIANLKAKLPPPATTAAAYDALLRAITVFVVVP